MVKVHARDGSTEDDAWEFIGTVTFEESASAEAAASFQKRLILEHAARMFPRLAVKQSSLECVHLLSPASRSCS